MGNTRSPDLDPIAAAVNSALGQVGPGLYGVACSGGADSLVLAHAAMAVAGPSHVVVLVIDHGLSPGSATVAESVAAWARRLGAAAVVRRVTVGTRASLEAAAREARYAALSQLALELGLAVILLGHTARDQAETVLMRILRGTGPAGLAAIPRRRALDATLTPVVRPLLAVPRAAIEAYVAQRDLRPWEDPMNDDPTLLRVRVRHHILPALRAENPNLDLALCRLAASAAEWTEVIDARARPHAAFPIDCTALAREPIAVRKRALALALEAAGLELGAHPLRVIDALVMGPRRGERRLDLAGGRLVRSYDVLDVARESAAPRTLVGPGAPYVLRTAQPGDRMRPARLKGRSRKLSDLYIDTKIPRAVRAIARVLVRTTTGAIVWAEHVGLAHEEAENLVPMEEKPPVQGAD